MFRLLFDPAVDWHASCDCFVSKANAKYAGAEIPTKAGGASMSNTRSFLFVGAAIMAGLLCREASAEDPSRAFIDRLSGEPFRTNSAGPVSTKIETNPAQAYIDRLAGATQVAEHLGPGTTAITTDTTQDFIDRVAAPHAFTTRGASTGRQRSAAAH